MGLDYYAILGVPRTATIYDIKSSYRKLALRLHPERKKYPQHPNPRPEGVFELPLPALPEKTNWELINEAYDVLSNSLRREIFDQFGEEGLKSGVVAPNGCIQPYAYHGDFMCTYFEFFGSFSPYADFIDAVTKPPVLYNTEEGIGVKHRDPAIEHLLHLDLEEVFRGGIKLVKIFRYEFVDEFKTKTEKKEVVLSVPISPGILEGTQLLFPEAGDRSPTKLSADIKFIICDNKHEKFRRDKSDLHMDYEISLKEALIGFRMTIMTIDGRKLEMFITDVIE